MGILDWVSAVCRRLSDSMISEGSTCGRDGFSQSTPPFTTSIVHPFPAQDQTVARAVYTIWIVAIESYSKWLCLHQPNLSIHLSNTQQGGGKLKDIFTSSEAQAFGSVREIIFNRLAKPSIRDASVWEYHACKAFGNWRNFSLHLIWLPRSPAVETRDDLRVLRPTYVLPDGTTRSIGLPPTRQLLVGIPSHHIPGSSFPAQHSISGTIATVLSTL